jgi:hypothetical protein
MAKTNESCAQCIAQPQSWATEGWARFRWNMEVPHCWPMK